jgi:hypothetical protein
MRGVLLLGVALGLSAQTSPDPMRVLARAREQFLARTTRLPNYTCMQTVERKFFTRMHPNSSASSCSDLRTRDGSELTLEATDRLRLDVKISDGTEIGSWAGASSFESRSIFDVIGGGPFGTGSFGTILWDIFSNAGSTFQFIKEEKRNNSTLFAYEFFVPGASSHSYVKAGSDWVPTAYEGKLWIDADSFDPKRLTTRTSELAPETGGCEALTTIDYLRKRLGASDFLIPERSLMHILMRDSTETETAVVYSGCREFVGQSTVRFEEVSSAPVQDVARSSPVALPSGLAVSLALDSPIDSDTAAAGDVFAARVRKDVRETHSHRLLIPAGSPVRGRIIRMQHWLLPPRHFSITVLLETIEIDGALSPFYARRDSKDATAVSKRLGKVIHLPPAGEGPNTASFVFTTEENRYLVSPGLESNWITVSAPRTSDRTY